MIWNNNNSRIMCNQNLERHKRVIHWATKKWTHTKKLYTETSIEDIMNSNEKLQIIFNKLHRQMDVLMNLWDDLTYIGGKNMGQ